MTRNTPYYLIVIGLFVLLKFWIGTFENSELGFLLKPTNIIFELVTGNHSEYTADSGYFYNSYNIVIDKSCSGYNFLLLCFVMLYFQVIKYAKRHKFKALLLLGSFTLAYFLTILINSSRIIISVVFKNIKFDFLDLEPHIIHESIGVLTYLLFLLITYFLTEKFLTKRYAQLS